MLFPLALGNSILILRSKFLAMKIHKEGRAILLGLGILLILINVLVFNFAEFIWIWLFIASLGFYAWVLQFFRNPDRALKELNNQFVYAPADGKIVVIEETTEGEYFKAPRIQISIFMSPNNVHVNRNPVGGEIKYTQHHPGKYLVAWHPKSSTENERHTVVLDNGQQEVLVRQIAGAMARRIINYLKVGQRVQQGEEMGFIKFGSRVDLFLPLDATIKVEIGQKVKGNIDLIAVLP